MQQTRLAAAAAVISLSFGSLVAGGCGGGSGTDTPPLPSRYEVSEIAKVPFQASFVARNRGGYVIGYNYVANAGATWDNGFVVSPEGEVSVIPDPEGFPRTTVTGISGNNKVIGYSVGVGPTVGSTTAAAYAGFVYDIPTNTLTRISSPNFPSGISDSGFIVGTDEQTEPFSLNVTRKGVLLDLASGTTVELPSVETVNGKTIFQATGINNSGVVVGDLDGDLALYSVGSQTLRRIPPTGKYDGRTYPGVITDSGTVSGMDHESRDFGTSRVFLYDVASGVKTYLPENLPTDGGSIPVNASGTAVVGNGEDRFVYRAGQIQELAAALSPEDRAIWKIEDTFAIDDDGRIYASAEKRGETEAEARASTYLLRLTPE